MLQLGKFIVTDEEILVFKLSQNGELSFSWLYIYI